MGRHGEKEAPDSTLTLTSLADLAAAALINHGWIQKTLR